MSLKQNNLSRERALNNPGLRERLLQVKTIYFTRLKTVTAVCFSLIAVLMVTVFQLNKRTKMQEAENGRLMAQVEALQDQLSEGSERLDLISASHDSTSHKALTYIESIQSKLSKINNYLTKRGLRSIAFKTNKINARKETKGAHLDVYSRYNRYLDKLVDNIARMPMGYPRVSGFTSFFGSRGNPFGDGRSEFHPGLDFKGRMGDPVKCTASGKVVFSGRAGGYGNCVKIRHTDNIETWYGHLSRINVREGQRVNVGQLIGKVGSTGRSTGPHLHYEVRRNGKAVNPKQYLSLN
ncbi:M23 family metallopeptidase [Mucilaginibacter aquatilis]|uniref:Peptidoglycan DD-metalloendopeptidase family protein n=1 Tax=Mucilaginibacter aquatilis TaxID=1517760 RepID=A0A6I4IB58_9SPHI|nr:M23 family metallopeptidase [Mucilaginibacter aquatilis]MVN92480.1 peptidoglycan DD-metalloendopeptidase family protein [Mucilaginibacter aquatilis]